MHSNFIRFSLQFRGAFGLVLAGLLLSLFSVLPAYAGGVVGDGTSASCTEAAFDAKLVGGGTITFNCGGAKTITFTTLKQIADNTILDGSGLITLNGSNAALFQIFTTRTFSLQNITLTNGQSSQGGAIQNFGITSITNSQLTNNRSTGDGGAIYNQGTLTLTLTTLSNNKAANSGAGIYHDGPSLSVNNSLFQSNVITGLFGTGGGLASNSGSVVVQASTFTNNTSPDGGAIFLNNSATVTLIGSTLISNTAGSGGGIENTGTLTVSQTIITLNRATGNDGGGIWNFGGQLTLQDTTVSSNTAAGTGGGISNPGLTLTLNRVTVSGNTAGGFGGGIFSSAAAALTNVTLSDNHTSANGGGGMYQDNGTATLNYVTVVSNTSLVFGGGLYKQGAGTMTVRDTLLTNNKLADNSLANCDGVVGSAGHNLSNDTHCGLFIQTGDQQNISLPLGPLVNNGGSTLTHLPLTGNPAINGGDCIGGVTTDQRTFVRPIGSTCDVGAVEVGLSVYLPVVVK